jgi:hypothetical protein
MKSAPAAEAELQHQRQEKGNGADADAEKRPADDARPECRDAQKLEPHERVRRAARMAHIGDHRDGAEDDAADRRFDRQEVAPARREPEHQGGEPETGEQETSEIERRAVRLADVLEIERREPDPEEPDRDIDEEDPAPVEIGRDEAAERRADYGPDHRRHGQIRERRDELALRDAAQEHEPADRNHHGAADPLQEARRHESAERPRRRAGERPRHEHAERGPKNGAGAIAVRHPAAHRDEDREADEIGGQRQLQRDRVLVEAFGDDRQRGRDDGRIRVLHEERGRDDERDEAGAVHL